VTASPVFNPIPRRQFIGAAALALLAAGCRTTMEETDLSAAYGLIGQMSAKPGKRDELIGYLLAGTDNMPGNLAYMINKDAADPDAIWIVEVWIDKAAHTASLQLPAVQAAIAKARPILAGFGTRAEVIPVSPLR
jgi:quinol monooxygenase YgiN